MNKSVFAFVMVATFSPCYSQSTFNVASGSWNEAGNWNPSGVPDSAATDVILPDNSTINALIGNINVGDLTTGGTVTFNNSINDSTVTVNGALSHASGTLTIQGSMGLIVAETGTGTFVGGLALSNGAGVLNQGSLVFGSGSPAPLTFTPATVPFAPNLYDFRNEGLVSFNPGTDVSLNNADIQNTGVAILATGGTSALLSSYSQTESSGERTTIVVSGSTLHANNVTLTRGSLYGNGTVDASSLTLGDGSNGVSLSPGVGTDEVGTLTLAGNLGTIGGSTWHFDLGGTAQGSQYDLVNAPQNLTVNGVLLSVGLVNGFTPQPGDSFTIISSVNISGGFSNVTGGQLTMPGVGTFDVAVGANAVVLSNFAAVPEPSTAVMIALGAMLTLVMMRQRRIA